MIQSGALINQDPLLKTGLPLIKNVIKPLAKSVLIPLGLTAEASAADSRIHKNILGSGHNNNNITTLIVSNDEIEDIIKIMKSLKDSGLLLKRVTETVQNEVKEQKGGVLSILLDTSGASFLENLLTGKGAMAMSQGQVIYRAGKGKGINRAGERITRAGYGNNFSNMDS